MRRASRLALLLLVLAGCMASRSAPPAPACTGRGEAPLTPEFLAGVWHFDLRVTRRADGDRGFGLDRHVTGRLTLEVTGASGAALREPLDCSACVRGVAHVPLDSVLRRPPAGWRPSGAMLAPEPGLSAETLRLRIYDGAAPLILTGERAGDLVCGRWTQESLDGGERGSFVLRRPAR